EANKDEKTKGAQVAEALCSKGSVEVLDEGVNDGPEEAEAFWKHIQTKVTVGDTKRTVNIQDADNTDEKGKAFVPVLYKTPDTLGDKFDKVGRAKPTPTGPSDMEVPKLKKSCLHEDEVLLLDTGFHVYIWVGTKANPSIKSVALHHTDSYFKSMKRPMLPVSVIKQDKESAKFSNFFAEEPGARCLVV
ncbi:MAG: hypothetical protein SGBAC_009802, partial [Bacillariaceae sp.]